MLLMSDIHVRSFSGAGLKPYLHSLAKLRAEVFRDSPYFEEPDIHRETEYLKKVASCKDSIAILIFDGTTLVGSAIGTPLSLEEAAVIKPFKDLELDIHTYYFLGESTLLKHYRGRGIGHHFFDARETHITHLQPFKHLCFCVQACCESPTHAHHEFVSLHDFWRKRGYVHHPELRCQLMRKKIDKTLPEEDQMSFWIKDL